MSGIYIKGMEMPHNGEFKHVRIYDNGDVTVELSDGEAVIAHASHIPPHGRLIDADAAKVELRRAEALARAFGYHNAVDAINDTPTIIESEG